MTQNSAQRAQPPPEEVLAFVRALARAQAREDDAAESEAMEKARQDPK
jgi:hypothetical protein